MLIFSAIAIHPSSFILLYDLLRQGGLRLRPALRSALPAIASSDGGCLLALGD